MRKGLSFRLMLSMLVVTVLVVLITSVVFTALFKRYAVSDTEGTLNGCAEEIARLVSEDQAGSYEYNKRTISDYSLFIKTVLHASVWVLDQDGTFRTYYKDDNLPLHLKELDATAEAAIRRTLRGESFLTSDFSAYFGEDTLSVLVPVHSTTFADGEEVQIVGAVLVHCPNKNVSRTPDLARNFLFVAVFVSAVFSVIVAFFLAERYTEPLKKMNRAAQQMSQGDYSVRTAIHEGGEIETLSQSLDNLAQTLSETIANLQAEKKKLNDIIDNVSDGLCAFDPNLHATQYNLAYMKMCSEEMLRQNGVADMMQQVMETKRAKKKVVSGEEILKFIATPTLEEDRVTGCVLIVQDISLSERLEKTRRDFVSDVSHEFRTPLTVVKGYLELLCDGTISDPEDVKRTYARMEKETVALENLVRDMLDLSRLRSGTVKTEISETDVSEIVETICDNMRTISAKKEIEILYQRQNIPTVFGNHDRLRQLFIILIDNAIKFTPKHGTITVLTEKEDEYVLIRVRDTGVGISKKDLPFVFERFYKADKSRQQTENSGSGLGLSIAAKIVEQLGGEIDVASEEGKGTEFFVRLRIYRKEDEA